MQAADQTPSNDDSFRARPRWHGHDNSAKLTARAVDEDQITPRGKEQWVSVKRKTLMERE